MISPRRHAGRYPQLVKQSRCSTGFTYGLGGSRSLRGSDAAWRAAVPVAVPAPMPIAPVVLDAQARTVRHAGHTVTLTPHCFLVLSRLLAADGALVTVEDLSAGQGALPSMSRSTLYTHVKLLREDLGFTIGSVLKQGYHMAPLKDAAHGR